MERHIPVKELPRPIQLALEEVGYHCRDISVKPSETYCISGLSGDGYKAFSCMVNMATGERKVVWGSWGGPNPWNRGNPVDLDNTLRPMPLDGAFIQGMIGGTERSCWATIEIHPGNVNKLLPPPAVVSEKESKILAVVRSIRGGQYRREYLGRVGATDSDLDSLVSRGLLSRNKAGAISITTEGKNSAAKDYY